MMAGYRLLLVCGFAAIMAFVAFLLVPQVESVRSRQLDLQILEIRARMPVEIVIRDESAGDVNVLSRDDFFMSLANIRAAAAGFGLEVAAFDAAVAYGFGMDETTVRVNLSGKFNDVVDLVYYLAGGVYNVRYLSLVNADTASLYIGLSIFHEE